MVKRHAEDTLAACASSCLDVVPRQQLLQQHHGVGAPEQPVLGSIENLPAVTINADSSRFASNKKQCRLGVDQGLLPNKQPVDVSSLFAQARALLRHPPSSSVCEAPIGREQEFQQLTEAFEEFSSTGFGSSLYVSGLPGTGMFVVSSISVQLIGCGAHKQHV